MNRGVKWRFLRLGIRLCLSLMLLTLIPSLVQAQELKLRVTETSSKSFSLGWDAEPGNPVCHVFFVKHGQERFAGSTTDTSITINRLSSSNAYPVRVDCGSAFGETTVLTDKRFRPPPARPTPLTCLQLPPRVAVYGHVYGTQCQMVDAAGVGRMDLIKRGVIDAVDVWSYVNGGLEVCFRNHGSLVFLDAAYLQRMLVELESFQRDGMTCGRIDGAGTVVLLAAAAPPDPVPALPDPAPAPPADTALPLFDAIPLADCQIKLVETLFLRAAPAGEIIGLVWMNSEVPAFEINGYWYKIEFEGVKGYISRYHRKVLSGNCG